MQCYAYCTAFSYNTPALFDSFHGRYKTERFEDVIQVEIPNSKESKDVATIFFFPYGAFVSWNLAKEKIEALLEDLAPYEKYPLDDIEYEAFTYQNGNASKFISEMITLPNDETISKLAFSHGLAQSAKLGAFEMIVQLTFESTKHLPEHLAKHGTIPLSRKKIRQQRGQLFLEKSSINLHLDALDTPEFFWQNPVFEPLYQNMATELDLEQRMTALNQQLDVLHDLFEMLGSELNDQHSHRLEWAIIYLIVIEVFLVLFHDILKLI
ncbi:MAG: RMD1 family protein [Chlamydiota bacterium]|nr:RMD1 family protein [Chlamydiota bacterium]